MSLSSYASCRPKAIDQARLAERYPEQYLAPFSAVLEEEGADHVYLF